MLGKKHKAAERTLPRGQVAPLYFLLPRQSQLKGRLALPQGPPPHHCSCACGVCSTNTAPLPAGCSVLNK